MKNHLKIKVILTT